MIRTIVVIIMIIIIIIVVVVVICAGFVVVGIIIMNTAPLTYGQIHSISINNNVGLMYRRVQ